MSSTRFAGKVLAQVGGKPVLQYVLERLQRAEGLDQIVVLTSREPSDNPIADFCVHYGIPCFCGHLQNVAQRFYDAVNHYKPDAFVRICADSPLIDPTLVDRAVTIFIEGYCDLVTNVYPRTFPRGQSVEVIRADTFRQTMPEVHAPEHREHVTKYFYDHAYKFSIFNMESSRNDSQIRLTIDEPADLEAFTQILAGFDRPHWEYGLAEILEIEQQLLATASS